MNKTRKMSYRSDLLPKLRDIRRGQEGMSEVSTIFKNFVNDRSDFSQANSQQLSNPGEKQEVKFLGGGGQICEKFLFRKMPSRPINDHSLEKHYSL